MRSVVFLGIILSLASAPAWAQGSVEGALSLGSKVVPLPPGTWRVLYNASEPGRSTEGNLSTTTYRAVLVQEHGNRAAAVIIASAASEMGGAWNVHGICVNTNAIQRDVQQAVRGALDCSGQVVVGAGRGANTPAYLNALYDEGVRRPGWMPPRWISVQLIQSQQMHYLSVEYRFAPAVFAPAAANAANWNEGARSAAQNEVVRKLADFAARAREQLQRGLYGRQPSTPLPWPF